MRPKDVDPHAPADSGAGGPEGGTPLLAVTDLSAAVRRRQGPLPVVRGVSFQLRQGQTLVLLGESGSGKSVTALALMDLLPTGVEVTGGRVEVAGTDLRSLTPAARRRHVGGTMAMVFQDSISALNPVMRVGDQIAEAVRQRDGASRAQARTRAIELMTRVRIPSAEQRYRDFPHEFSGGMRQRVVIAIALALRPRVLIADEPTTALDVSVQAQILALLAELQQESRMGLVLITHDLGVAATVADRVAVMYAGRIVEIADAAELFNRPVHPYTAGLFGSVPQMSGGGSDLRPIPGSPPSLVAIPRGCPFHPRCPLAVERCRVRLPEPENVREGHTVACHLSQEIVNGR
ncbi:ABC transporter ATP-binding protein [Streptosporangium violaceochromogenes]|nr:ABC transporter ATP-binding protein [Streptosporangium violaceochromogenes]